MAGPFPFKMYSGYLTVAGPLGGPERYDSIVIHYELHTSQRSPSTDPILTWHQGGPGGSSMYGAYAEMGYFQTDSNGTHTNPFAWNRIANMLYLESPAGCDDPIGFSYCTKNGRTLPSCSWTDKTQAEAYAHTLAAFFQEFPEFISNDLYMTGESVRARALARV
jgi:carboxypeptidase C (cathepsin A)|eukprot:SAG25_NODE_681_length_5951_cov_1.849795_3_plen_164_part_00